MAKNQPVSETVYNIIARKIIDQEWSRGMKITSENQMAQELGVSRVSVREAIEKLATLGILSKRQGEGTFVNKFSPSLLLNRLIPMVMLEETDIIEVQEFRLMLEIDSAKLCAKRCGSETIAKLEEYYRQMCEINDVSPQFAEADFQFHRAIAEGSGNSLVIKLNTILYDLFKLQQTRTNESIGPDNGLIEHKNILEAVKNRDSELAAIFMRRHVQNTIDLVNAKLKSSKS